jgi:hypothetical protein
MMCVKLPKSVLVVFYLLEQVANFFRELKASGLITLRHVSSWRSVVRFALDKAASYRRMSSSDSA